MDGQLKSESIASTMAVGRFLDTLSGTHMISLVAQVNRGRMAVAAMSPSERVKSFNGYGNGNRLHDIVFLNSPSMKQQ